MATQATFRWTHTCDHCGNRVETRTEAPPEDWCYASDGSYTYLVCSSYCKHRIEPVALPEEFRRILGIAA